MNTAKTTPKDFFLWAGAMVALYAGVVSFITLLFNYINYAFPDPLSYAYLGDPYSSGIPYQMASLIVLAPLLLVLMRLIRKYIAADPSRAEIWVRRWALYLTVFAAGATIVVDLIVLLTTFLSGESLTTAFLLKVLVVLLVAGGGFMHFLADLWGFWEKNPGQARMMNWGVGAVVLAAIVGGFFIVGSPATAREYRLDEQKTSDLQNIQWQIVNYWQQTERMPDSLAQLEDPIAGFSVPMDPQTGEAYEYRTTGPLAFELCATFNREDRFRDTSYARPVTAIPGEVKGVNETWEHAAGRTCFERTIDPERYPPFTR